MFHIEQFEKTHNNNSERLKKLFQKQNFKSEKNLKPSSEITNQSIASNNINLPNENTLSHLDITHQTSDIDTEAQFLPTYSSAKKLFGKTNTKNVFSGLGLLEKKLKDLDNAA